MAAGARDEMVDAATAAATNRRRGGRTALLVAAGLVGAAIGAAWQRRREDEHAVAELLRTARPADGAPVAESELARLPAPVSGWLRASSVVGARSPAVVRMEQEGRLTTGPDARWRPFRARQWTTIDPPGYLWFGRASLAPGSWIGIRDGLRAGRGSSTAALWGLVPAGSAAGPGIDEASLQRWLGELVWMPAAALDPAIAWRESGSDAAEATLTVGDIAATVAFSFDAAGRVRRVEADRWRADVRAVQRWRVLLSGWTPRAGVVVPSVAEVVWEDPAGAFTGIQMRVGKVEVVR